MKTVLIYVEGHSESELCRETCETSLKKWGWDYEPIGGITPKTLDESEFPFKDVEGGRLQSFRVNEPHKYPIKKSCLFNNLRFATKVYDAGESMIFLEHDTEVIGRCEIPFFQDFLFLSMDYAFKPPSVLSEKNFSGWQQNYQKPLTRVYEFPRHMYPLKYYKDSVWSNSMMVPGTSAYALSPYGAEKLLKAVEKHGLEQSDYIYNSKVLHLEALNPSIVKLQKYNPNLSHRGVSQ